MIGFVRALRQIEKTCKYRSILLRGDPPLWADYCVEALLEQWRSVREREVTHINSVQALEAAGVWRTGPAVIIVDPLGALEKRASEVLGLLEQGDHAVLIERKTSKLTLETATIIDVGPIGIETNQFDALVETMAERAGKAVDPGGIDIVRQRLGQTQECIPSELRKLAVVNVDKCFTHDVLFHGIDSTTQSDAQVAVDALGDPEANRQVIATLWLGLVGQKEVFSQAMGFLTSRLRQARELTAARDRGEHPSAYGKRRKLPMFIVAKAERLAGRLHGSRYERVLNSVLGMEMAAKTATSVGDRCILEAAVLKFTMSF